EIFRAEDTPHSKAARNIDLCRKLAPHGLTRHRTRRVTPLYDTLARGGEGHLVVGRALESLEDKDCHLFINVKPFGCMPATQADGVMALVAAEHPDLLFLPLETLGEGEIHALNRVQMALADARRRARQEFEAALGSTGKTLEQRTFEIEIDGKKQVLPYGKMVGLYESPNRDLRRRAHETVYSGLGKDHIIWSSALRAVCSDHLQVCKLRQWPSPMTQSLIDNDVDEEAIHALMKTIEKNVKVYRSYLELKAKAMGLKRLGNWDITAPLPDLPDKTYTWDEAREIILDAYSSFDEEAGNYIREMYDRRHIDAEVRNGKRSGAFCSTWFAGKSAYILQSFNGTMGDVFTQAHELGHALHAYLGSRAQTPVNYRIGSCIAETGSIFGELLLTEKLLSKASSAAERRGILAKVLDEFGEAAFQVSTRVWFETMLYEAISNGEHLDGETVSQLWLKARDKMYGDSVEWLPEMKWWWTMKLHFYLPNYRYYNYPYVYAQLFVYAMYRLYKEQGKAFVPVLKSLLAAGSSKSPRELAAVVGFDVTKESSWQKGIDQFAEFAKMFKKTLEDK
ncbi:MAG: M3 family metallopeptidase, partial [Candidatus Thorarchaeota archaeon]